MKDEGNAKEAKIAINERVIEMQSTHDQLLDGRRISKQINEYVSDLRCLKDEAEFHVQIAELKPGQTDQDHKGFHSISLHKFLRATAGKNPHLKPIKAGESLRWVNISCNNIAWVADVLHTVSNAACNDTTKNTLDITAAVLDEEVWKSNENKPHHRSPHARWMTPLFRAFLPPPKHTIFPHDSSDDPRPRSVSFLPIPSNSSQLVLYVSLPRAPDPLKYEETEHN